MSIRHELFKRLRDPRGQQANKGWAGRSLERSVGRVLLLAMVSWQCVMVLAAISSLGLTTTGYVLAAMHLAAIGAALAVLRFGVGNFLAIAGWWTLFVIDWATAPIPESALLFAACWMCNLNSTFPAFLLRGRTSWVMPLVASAVIPVLMVITRPEWVANPLVPGVFVTAIAITIATRIGLSYLVDYTNDVDAEEHELQEAIAALTTRKSATYQAAEDARVLHDTAINTLGAIANGGAAINDLDVVRRRCLADIAAIEILRSAKNDHEMSRHGFRDAMHLTGIRVRYVGMSDDEITNTEELLPPHVMRAFSRAVAEALQNAAKHSGADEAIVSIHRTPEGVRVTVRDQGIGIQKGERHGTGIKRSILERSREVGIRATIDSTPGQGTTVILDYAIDDAADQARSMEVAGSSVEDVVHQLRSRSAFALSGGLVGVGVTLAALNHPGEATPEWLMVVVVATACWLAWRERNNARLSMWTTIALIVSGPLAFFMSAWAVGFGRTNPVLWQAIAPIGPLVLLTIVSLPRIVKIFGFVAYSLTAGLIAASVAPISMEAASITVLAGLLGLGLILGVTRFIRSLAMVASRANKAQREAFKVGLELAAVEAAAEAKRRWRHAGLEQSVNLLRVIGDGQADPRDPMIQAQCAQEEAFLRQLSLLNPELIQMGMWFARALNASRLRGVGLIVRSGAVDANAEAAPQFGHSLLTVIDTMPLGTKLTTTFFATAKGLAMTLVGPTPHLIAALGSKGHHVNHIKLHTYGAQDLAELVLAGSGS